MIIVVFGGATLLLQDKTFIMWKPTVLYGLFAAILAVGKLGFGRDLIAYLMKGVSLPAAVWTRLTWAWVAFFVFMGVANWYVAFHYSEQTWVITRSGAASGSSSCSRSLQGLWLARHAHRGDGVSAPSRRPRWTSPRDCCARGSRRSRRRSLEIRDDSAAHAGHAGAAGGGGHFSLMIVSKAFSGLSRLARHQRVLREVADLVPHPIHALSIKALAPEEFPSQP